MFQICSGNNLKRDKRGIILLEIIIAIALFTIVSVSILGLLLSLINTSAFLQKQNKAEFLLKEYMEATRVFRDSTASSWGTTGIGGLSTGAPYHLVLSGTPPTWSFTAGSETTDGFTKQVIFERVSRDANSNIVLSGGTDDPDTRKVTVQVSFGSKSYQISTYLTNWQK